MADRFGPTLEAVDLSWGGSRITDAAVGVLADRCPRLHSVGLAGTAVTTGGVRHLLAAADAHAAEAAAAAAAGATAGGRSDAASSEARGSSSAAGDRSSAAGAGRRPPFRLDVGSCRGLDRQVRQAAALGMAQLRAALGLPPAG